MFTLASAATEMPAVSFNYLSKQIQICGLGIMINNANKKVTCLMYYLCLE